MTMNIFWHFQLWYQPFFRYGRDQSYTDPGHMPIAEFNGVGHICYWVQGFACGKIQPKPQLARYPHRKLATAQLTELEEGIDCCYLQVLSMNVIHQYPFFSPKFAPRSFNDAVDSGTLYYSLLCLSLNSHIALNS